MIEVKPTKKLLFEFVNDLREPDLLEFKQVYKDNSLEEFYNVCLDNNHYTYFLLTDDFKPLALGGAYCTDYNKSIARVWLLSSNQIKNNRINLYKYIKEKIIFFKNEYKLLYNFIFKTNFGSLNWLKTYGFNVLDINNKDYKLFYFSKGENNFDIRYFTCE